MQAFRDVNFVDVSQVFNWRRGAESFRLRRSVFADLRDFAPVPAIESAVTPESKFFEISAFRPVIEAPVVEAPVERPVLKLKEKTQVFAASEAPAPVAAAEETPRKTLKLKTQVELPVISAVTRRTSISEFAAAFKAELARLEKDPGLAEAPAAPPPRRSFSQKSWAELIAEAEEAPKPKNNFDLAAAFKAEMRALLAEQGQAEAPRLKTAFEPKIKASPQHKPAAPRRVFAASVRTMAA